MNKLFEQYYPKPEYATFSKDSYIINFPATPEQTHDITNYNKLFKAFQDGLQMEFI